MKKPLVKSLFLAGIITLVGGMSYAAYLYNMPHRDVQSVKAFTEIKATALVNEFLNDPEAANDKYLAEDGDSKVVIVTGSVDKIFEDQKQQRVVVLKAPGQKVGVSCTFTAETNRNVALLQVGEYVKIKGVIRSGGEIDEDLDLYEDVIIEKSDVVM